MKNSLKILIVLLLVTPSLGKQRVLDVKAIGEAALRSGRITPPPRDQDFRSVPPGVEYEPNQLLVRFAPREDWTIPDKDEKQAILMSSGGASILHEYDLIPGLVLLRLAPGQTVEKALKTFNSTKGIMFAEPNYLLRATAQVFPNDWYFSSLWGMHNTGQTGGTNDADIDAPEAWDISTGSSSIVVAVIDSGVDYTHEDLAGNMWVNIAELYGQAGKDDDGHGWVDDIYGYDCLNNDGDPMDDFADVYHGTHVAGTLGAVGNNGRGVTGVCWSVRIMALKFLDNTGKGNQADAVECINYAIAMGARVINASWGDDYGTWGLMNAIEVAGQAGIVFVAAAGNYDHNFYPAIYGLSNMISVLSTDEYDLLSGFSNYGMWVHIGAPGSNIWSCKRFNDYQYLDGTSMASPHVSGACGLLLSMNPFRSPEDMREDMMSNGDFLPALAGKCASSRRLNIHRALHDDSPVPEGPVQVLDTSEGIAGWFDVNGNLVLKGIFVDMGESDPPTNFCGFRVQNASSACIAALTDAGNMWIAGVCYECLGPLDPSNACYIVRDAQGTAVAYINSDGNLYLKGRLFEEYPMN